MKMSCCFLIDLLFQKQLDESDDTNTIENTKSGVLSDKSCDYKMLRVTTDSGQSKTSNIPITEDNRNGLLNMTEQKKSPILCVLCYISFIIF